MKTNLNYHMTIYPNESGWKEIERLTAEYYKPVNPEMDFSENVAAHKTKSGGYMNQTWFIIEMFHSMFFNGSPFFKSTEIEIGVKW